MQGVASQTPNFHLETTDQPCAGLNLVEFLPPPFIRLDLPSPECFNCSGTVYVSVNKTYVMLCATCMKYSL